MILPRPIPFFPQCLSPMQPTFGTHLLCLVQFPRGSGEKAALSLPADRLAVGEQ